MSIQTPVTPRLPPVITDRGRLALLSALAEAPDLSAAATFLLTDVLATTGASRALLLRFDREEEELVLVAQAGAGHSGLTEYAIGERSHPWMIASLTMTPVVNDGLVRQPGRVPF